MSQPTGSIYEIRWHELCPWLVLAKALRVSLLIRVLLYAWLGLILTQWGWSVCESLVFEPTAPTPRIDSSQPYKPSRRYVPPSELTTQTNRIFRETARYANITEDSFAGWAFIELRKHVAGPLIEGWRLLSFPFVSIFYPKTDIRNFLLLLCCGLWSIAVWGIFGGAIARTAARYGTRDEIIGPLAAGRAAISKWPSTAGAPLIVLGFAALMTIPLAILGLLIRADLLAMLAGFFWFLALVWGVLLAIVLVALWFGWPLMWATIAVERSDAFDAASRTAAYVYQRPLRLVFYVVVASFLGIFGQLVVSGFATAGNHLTDWAVSWGAGHERIAQLTAVPIPGEISPTLAGSAALAEQSITFWKQMLATFAAAYPLAYLFSASVGIYLLLRLHVDSTEMDEIVGEPSDEVSSMPELKVDGSGVPSVVDDDAEDMSTRQHTPPT